MKLIDIITLAIAVFETSISKALNNGEIDEQEFQVLQKLHLKVINELANVDCKMESETRNQFQRRDKDNLKNERHLIICSLFPVCYLACYQNG